MSLNTDMNNSRFFTALLGLYFTSLYIPLLSTGLYCILMALIIALSFIKYPIESGNKALRLLLIFFCVELVYPLVGKGLSWQNTLINSLCFLTGLSICRCLIYLSEKQIRTIFVCLLVVLAYTLLWSYYYLLSDPMYVRKFGYTESEEFAMPFYQSGIKYGNGEALSIMLPLVLAYCVSSKKKITIALTALIVIAGIGIQIMASLTTSAFLSIIFCSLVLMRSVGHTSNKYRLISAIFVISVVVIVALRVFSFDINYQMLMKIEDVNESVNTGHATGQVGTRFELYMQSIKTFLHNPILGLGKTSDFGSYTENTVGMHTAVFDFLALYGMFALLLYGTWKNVIAHCFSYLQDDKKKLYACSVPSLIFLLLLKGPVTIGTNYIFSTAVLGLFIMQERNRIINNTKE